MKAADIMTTSVICVRPETEVKEIARQMIENHVSAVPVVDAGNRLVGIVSEGDLMWRNETGGERHTPWWLRILGEPEQSAAEYRKSHGKRAGDVMTRDVVTVKEDAEVAEIARLLEQRRIKRVPVVRDGQVVGIVSRANLLNGLVVAPPEARPTTSDRTLRNAVWEAIASETSARTQFVNIVVRQGTVHLFGAVRSEAEREAVRRAAKGVPGVGEVNDHLGIVANVGLGGFWTE